MQAHNPLIRRAAALLILACALALLWIGPVSAYLDLVADNADRIGERQQLLQRYRALSADNHSPAQLLPPGETGLLFPDIAGSQALALLQETVKSAAATAKIQIQGFQVLQTEPLAGATRIAVRVRGSGDTAALARLLYAIEASRPLLYSDNLQVQSHATQPAAAVGAGTPALDFQLDVTGFKPGSAT